MPPRQARLPISRLRWAILYSEQGGRCAGCHKPLGDDVHVDHVVPLACGGEDRFENLQLLHGACNLEKRAIGAALWFERCWQRFVTTSLASRREHLTIAVDPELAERLRIAAYWSRNSVGALVEEGAGLMVSRVEETGPRAAGAALRLRREADLFRKMSPPAIFPPAVNGDLFGDLQRS